MGDLVDMKRSSQDDQEGNGSPIGMVSGETPTPQYHHGLTVHLGHPELQKLGMDTLPQVGDKLKLHAHAHVKEVREENTHEGIHRHVTLELRKMAIEGHKPGNDVSKSEHAAKGAKAEMEKALKGKNRSSTTHSGTDDDEDDEPAVGAPGYSDNDEDD